MSSTIILSPGPGGAAPLVVDDPTLPAGHLRIDLPDNVATHIRRTTPLIGLSVPASEYALWHGLIGDPSSGRLPGAAFGRTFAGPGDGLPRWNTTKLNGLIDRGITVWASAKDRAPAAAYTALFDGIPAGEELFFTHHHEPVADGLDPADYRDEYRLIRQVADEHPNRDRIHIFAILEAYAARFKRLDWRPYVPTEHVDGIGFDCYWREDFDYEDPTSLIGMPALAAQEFGLRWSIPELGATTTRRGRPSWFRDVVTAAGAAGCESVGLWCTRKTIEVDGTGHALEYRPVDGPTLTAFRDLLALNRGT